MARRATVIGTSSNNQFGMGRRGKPLTKAQVSRNVTRKKLGLAALKGKG